MCSKTYVMHSISKTSQGQILVPSLKVREQVQKSRLSYRDLIFFKNNSRVEQLIYLQLRFQDASVTKHRCSCVRFNNKFPRMHRLCADHLMHNRVVNENQRVFLMFIYTIY